VDTAPRRRARARVVDRLRLRSALSGLLIGSRFLPVWVATALLFVVAAIVAPEALQSAGWAFVLPYMTILAVAALGQMFVIMQAGIDLSIPGVMLLGGNLVLGVSGHSDE
jgi:ribose/xylose/arabinose/galactoside ABC-type transport system permease subunit